MALLLLICARATFAADVAERPLVQFRGNVLFDELLYRSVVDLPANARATPAEARAVSMKLQGFLHRAGYDLAVVRAQTQGGQIMVEIDADEESLGGHLHGAFGGSTFAPRLASTGVEFRYSLLRDVFKMGLFYNQAVFGALDRTTGIEAVTFAGAGGPAAHLLLADQFQIDAYLALGWKANGATALSPELVLRQVF